MGNRHCKVREPGGLLGEVWRGHSFCFQEAGSVPTAESVPLKSSFTLVARRLAHSMESCSTAAEPASLLGHLLKR